MASIPNKSDSRPKGHPIHQGRLELRNWTPEPQWFHPLICRSVANVSRLILGRLNHLSFKDKERWDNLFTSVQDAKTGSSARGILSFSNHVSLFDDPLLISSLGITDFKKVRWIAADHINFFGNRLKGLIYSGGKCVPIIRGGGLKQPGFDFLIDRLKQGDWVHIFPEGGRSREENHRLQLPLKIGIGKIISEAKPIVMPFYHYGMHNVMPIGSTLPKLNQRVTVQFGYPTTIDQDWLASYTEMNTSPYEVWQNITLWVRNELLELERKTHPISR